MDGTKWSRTEREWSTEGKNDVGSNDFFKTERFCGMNIDKELEDIFDDPLLEISNREAELFDIPKDMRKAMKKMAICIIKAIAIQIIEAVHVVRIIVNTLGAVLPQFVVLVGA